MGREADLARVRALLPREPLFFIYGVAGIGKSELVYKIVEEARALPSLRRASTIALSARAGLRCEHLLSILRLRLGVAAPESPAGLADNLNAVASALQARPTLVFLDDVHNLDADGAGEMLGYLARHVSRSRIFVASRLEILLPSDTPPPVVCRLPPLSREATAALLVTLSHTLGLSPPDPAAVFTRSGGSPFHILRELADLRYAPRRGEDSLAAALRDLAPPLRHTLLVARLLRGRLAPADLRGGEALWELSRRFLIDIDRGVIIVHDLIGEALSREVSPEELKAARRDAALLLLRTEVPPHDCTADLSVDVVEAVRYLAAAGEPRAAWEALERWQHVLARLALDHLALEILPALRAALPERQQEVALRTAQILVRHARIAEAQALLDELSAADPRLLTDAIYLRRTAAIAQRKGALDHAAALLNQALSAVQDPRERLHAALQLADVEARRGEGAAARRGLLSAFQAYGPPPPEEEGRLGWARALSFLIEGRLTEAGAAAAEAAERLPKGEHAEATRVKLAILELIARCACDEVDTASALLKHIQRHESATLALHAPTVTLCKGLLHSTRGELLEARAALDQAHESLSAYSDPLPAFAAGYYLGLTLLGLGDTEGAQAAASRTAQHVKNGGLVSLVPHCKVLEARVHLQALRLREAQTALEPLLKASGSTIPRWVQAQAEALHALLHGLRGDAEAARAALGRAARLAQESCEPDGTENHGTENGAKASTTARRRELDLAEAEVRILCGDADLARARATAAQTYYEARGRRYAQAQAALLRAASLVAPQGGPARGDPHEQRDEAAMLSEAEALLALAQELSERYGYALSWAPLVSAALRRRQGDDRRARLELSAAQQLPSAKGEAAGAGLQRPETAVRMRVLGLLPPEPRAPDRQSDRPDLPDAAGLSAHAYDLVIDLRRNSIHAPGCEQQVAGRPLLCALLAHLVRDPRGARDVQTVQTAQAPQDDSVFSAERLFHEVWGGREYHPLRHRNTIYVAITRLRRALQDLLPGREVVETTPQGWRLAKDISLCVLHGDAERSRSAPAA